ncbi:MAG TPA: 50S ribosomal protein L20 [Gammaproteobacteria bacterium]|nr:50S ribosomal protein L20 [Gammaproteobacteria bacterium]
MSRVKHSVASRKRHKKILKQAKGYYGARSRSFKVANQAVTKAGQYAYRDRRAKKRDFRSLWIVRINAALRQLGYSYSKFMGKFLTSGIDIDRKMLAELAYTDMGTFKKIVNEVMA